MCVVEPESPFTDGLRKHVASERFVRPSLIMDLEERSAPRGSWRLCTFDIVLAPA
jgi:hypothetical protein